VTAEEIAKIKLLLALGWGPAIVGPSYLLLEGSA